MLKLDTNRAEATALCNGIIDSQLLNSTGNREVGERRGAEGERLSLRESDGFVSLV